MTTINPTPYEKGRALEKSVAQQLRRKGFKAYRDKRSGAGEVYKADIAVPGFLAHLECKNQKKVTLKEWWEQTEAGCPIYKKPLLVIQLDSGQQLAVMNLDHALDLFKEIQDDTETITKLRSK